MAAQKWTPGPWEFDTVTIDTGGDGRVLTGEVRDGNNHVIVEFSNSECSELIYEDDGEYGGTLVDLQQIANARLIAAAPELYDALHAVMLEFGPGTMSDAAFSRANTALALARGDKER